MFRDKSQPSYDTVDGGATERHGLTACQAIRSIAMLVSCPAELLSGERRGTIALSCSSTELASRDGMPKAPRAPYSAGEAGAASSGENRSEVKRSPKRAASPARDFACA